MNPSLMTVFSVVLAKCSNAQLEASPRFVRRAPVKALIWHHRVVYSRIQFRDGVRRYPLTVLTHRLFYSFVYAAAACDDSTQRQRARGAGMRRASCSDGSSPSAAGDNVDCWMEIQDGKGPWASPVTGIVPLGSTLTMVVAINDPNGKTN